MQLLKLIFEHDIPLDRMSQSPAERKAATASLSLEDFMRPQPVFSHFYLTGTRLENEPFFGLSTLDFNRALIARISETLNRATWSTANATYTRLEEAVSVLEDGHAATAHFGVFGEDIPPAAPVLNTGNPDTVAALQTLLEHRSIVIYKEKAHHGWDLQIYSLDNIYPALFAAFKTFLKDDVRFFSMNGKKVRSERVFYFETWALGHPPHGVEEVFEDTEI